MLSHLRFHRRGASNPASPVTDQHQSLSPLGSHDSPLPPDSASPSDVRPPSSSSSAFPPVLPPIARVTSADADLQPERRRGADPPAPSDPRPQQALRAPYNGDSGFIGGVALQNYRRDVEAHQYARPGSIDLSHGDDPARRQRPMAVSAATDVAVSKHYTKPIPTFSTPLDLQNSAPTGLGRRPAGARLHSDAQLAPTAAALPEPQKGKKGLPFLKNPMSTLLMRRKNNQNAPDIRPLPLSSHQDEPIYDPRIKGTRVHDFSAPRRKHNGPGYGPVAVRSGSQTDLSADSSRPSVAKEARTLDSQPRQTSNASESTRSEPPAGTASQLLSRSSVSSQPTRAPSVEQGPVLSEGKPAPPVPPKDHVHVPSRSTSSTSPTVSNEIQVQEAPRPAASQRTTRSRNISLSEISAVPRHMKSTSSRFSFDMVGAAEQEKLLEERHRQRELERKASGADEPRDSRFDDFDEDAFDYDAMMDDDGLEERIPGVNADFDDEEEVVEDEFDNERHEVEDEFGNEGHEDEDEFDPDNDQENFAGFVFQRSNPTSSLGSPQSNAMLNTPRDAEGRAIGFAMTKDTPSLATFPLSPHAQSPTLDQALAGQAAGLGIQDTVEAEANDSAQTSHEDELYFDNGMIGLENEFAEDLAATPEYDTAPFDESIFDNNDTDQFGRPVPGAFAKAQSQRRAADHGPSAKRESDITSRHSAHSGTSHSTAHTSLSVDARKYRETPAEPPGESPLDDEASISVDGDGRPEPGVAPDPVAAYQAELAAAAHKAAASGKFQRSASPPQDEDERSQLYQDDPTHEDLYDDEYDQGFVNMDDFELDDDGIIAEANASALASDSDGWYGQEFGFYSAPGSQAHGSQGSQGSSLSESSGYEYANGGFFGPKGMAGLDRSMSGRMASREPNLTPITERSEYSNRNSLMSMGFPPLSSSTPVVQSPGLVQLAMMADNGDDQMTLSALLWLRSKAWGGSQASLVSSREGSPRSDRGDVPSSPWSPNPVATAIPGPSGGHIRKSSTFSTLSRDSDVPSGSASPTLTMANATFASSGPAPQGSTEQLAFVPDTSKQYAPASFDQRQLGMDNLTGVDWSEAQLPPVSERGSVDLGRGLDSRTASMSSRPSGRGHHRHKSSADSVSYLKEEDSGETRWVMERRRTGESGEVEILQREVVEGGRI
ncbi:GPI ethanolamine phosphate transferase 2 [Purpureocillium lavendulum]|uniref:GPI ethanolamine phosphate transferase 2 n=1 Tax=Purpureocillium lavendulum TaxID=1247861 RepID=A0AB34FS37_9HYPO|nr:GPI ethanolamine phosphate transferase 2 [Purpureocillium lavendulum]